MTVGLLGPLEVRADGMPVTVPRGRPAAVLAALALAAGRTVSTDALLDQIWPGRTGDARNSVAISVSRLRKVLGSGAVVADAGGYRLTVPPDAVDATRFTKLLEAAEGDASARLARVEEALRLWRGEPLAGVGVDLPVAVGHLRELRLGALELAAELRLELGRHHQVAAELPALVSAFPLHERFTSLLMVARYRAGRQGEALQAFEQLRHTLAEELGVDPGPATRRLHQQILEADPALDAATPRTTPAQLPAPPPHLVGRSAQLAELGELLGGDPSIAVLTGPAGVGKTALALAWAHSVRAELPDGQLYLDLNGFGPGEPVPPGDALTALLRALGVADIADSAPLDARAALLRTALADRRMLVVLDNARDGGQVLPLLPGSGCVTVITSRDRLAGVATRHAARRLVLDALAPAEAVRLLGAVAGTNRVDAEPAAAAELVELCDRLPLATTIAAERVAQAPDVPIAEVAAELDVDHRRLDVLETAGDLTTSMRAVLDWSYGALPLSARRLLRLIAVHPSRELDLAAAAAAAGVPVTQARRGVDTLAGLHLARRVPGNRLALHDLIRAYARDLLEAEPAAERDEAGTRLFDWYLHTVAHACWALDPRTRSITLPPPPADLAPLTFDREEALRWCESERRSVRAIAEAAADAGRHRAVGDLAALYWAYLDLRGQPAEVATVCRLALRSARALGDRATEALLLNRMGIAVLLLGEFDRAEEHMLAALELDRQRGDRTAEAETLTNLARALVAGGRARDAVQVSEEALARLDRPEKGWRAWNNLATALQQAGRPREALDAVARALDAADLHEREPGDRDDRQRPFEVAGMKAYTRDTRAWIHLDLGEWDEALADFRHAHRTAVQLGEWRLEAAALTGAGQTLHVRGEPSRAHRVWSSALDVYLDVEAHAAASDLRRTMRTCCVRAASAS
ncbi:MAG TPA: BTAD domain-containing putative transcriptional regulator [Actinophytocola sp.]|jgi:DNA-binding SARP family transcriptional activator|nr:BTAD domain-containing putative transcriptional regulator [Actinophytocola sp.]